MFWHVCFRAMIQVVHCHVYGLFLHKRQIDFVNLSRQPLPGEMM